ncbi:hypothetical protein LguiB_013392 [Lonicera macranthoides]
MYYFNSLKNISNKTQGGCHLWVGARSQVRYPFLRPLGCPLVEQLGSHGISGGGTSLPMVIKKEKKASQIKMFFNELK